MGILDTGIKILQDIKYEFSDDPFMVGLRFEDYVQGLFSKKYFAISEKTHSTETNQKQYVESSMNPDFVFRYMPTGKQFAVECKYRSGLKEGRLSWSYPKQMKRYQEFSHKRKIPVFIVIGLGGEDNEPEDMFNIPLEEAKYPDLYPSVINRFSRLPDKPFFWKNGKLY
ncbi:MAG: hypothetical protein C4B59_00600 [Candidatus Methanogaster sp.]|uniref:Uncharacterized protein n=1 Tax=Candidatus Methanogaster sp. TaxID=3386292 RepID=A0AC61L6Q7_9EURY|nr:MAG: hypothetical protein C4B59_00600 [ANME-2 cluster archaeon]